jgi:hypothetical protein
MTTVKQFIASMRGNPIHRGLPSSRKLHSLDVRRAHIVAMRDWLDAREEKAKEKAKEDAGAVSQAMFKIRSFGRKFRPWLRSRAAR